MSDSGSHQGEIDRSNTPRPPRRRLWTRLLLYAVIFMSGGVVGVGGALLVVRAQALRAVHHPEEMPARIAARLRSMLVLNGEQTHRIEEILRTRQQALQAIRRKFQPEAEAELDKLEREVSDVLDEEQRAKWRERFQTLRDTWIPAVPERQSPPLTRRESTL